MPSGAKCKAGVCDCADGESYIQGRCRPLNGLDQTCDKDSDCYFGYDRESVQCHNKTCKCANGYYRRHGNICRRKSMEIGDACVVDTDCDNLGASVKCMSLKCRYVNEHKESDSATSAATATKSKKQTSTTTATASEEATSNLSKASNIGSDIDSETDPDPEPAPESEPDHETEPEPDFESQPETSPQPEPEPQIRTEATSTQKSREVAVQTSIDGLELKSFVPKVKHVGTATASNSSSSRRPSRQRHRLAAFRFDDEEKTYSTLSNTDDDADDADDRRYGSSCTENGKSCAGLPHSICSNSICLCRQGYYNRSGKCFAELGEIAESTDQCEHAFNDLSKKCICQKNYFYERNLRHCRKPIQYHHSCTSNSQCSPFGAAFCRSEIPRRCTCEQYAEYDALLQMCVPKQGLGSQCESGESCRVEHAICSNHYCVCQENYLPKNDTCAAGVGADCKEDADCSVENSECKSTTPNNSDDKEKSCQCRKGFVHFKDDCLKEAEEIEEECIDSEQCKPLLASCIDRKCSCTPEQHLKNGHCETQKEIGETCSRAGECFVERDPESVECRNSVCQCKLGYQSDPDHRTCIRVLPNKKNSSGRPSALKIVTFLLIGSAFLITGAAIKQAYY